MQCDVCKKKPATIFLTQIIGGKVQKVNLCEPCSKEKGVADPTGFALTDLLLGVGSSDEVASPVGGNKCPACGFSQAELKKTGRLGCSECYETFAEALESLLRGMHKGLEHHGKIPARAFQAHQREVQLRDLRKGLEDAVAEENYEAAADLRDQLKQLELGLEQER